MAKLFYRVNHVDTQQGLWYNYTGDFTGLIHDKFSFCLHKDLKMDYDPEIVGYVSAVETLEQLRNWFPVNDVLKLQEHGFYIHQYLSDDYKWYDRFQHYVINQNTAVLYKKEIVLSSDVELI